MIKIALCFIISGEHILYKEKLWYDWIEQNKDIINVYFYYENYDKIKSEWIKKNSIPTLYIKPTSYFYVIPAYIGLIKFALHHDKNNEWFCFLTESCIPMIEPLQFRILFFENYKSSIMSWCRASWNVSFNKRANLHLLSYDYYLKNTPYFILNRNHAILCLLFMKEKTRMFITICNGGVANESLFAIIFKYYNVLQYIKNEISTITDWSRMTSSTSPYVFKKDTIENIKYMEQEKKINKYSCFLRKIDKHYPDNSLTTLIYSKDFVLSNRFSVDNILSNTKNIIYTLYHKYINNYYSIIPIGICLFSVLYSFMI